MKIGITERGDAGLDFTWAEKLKTGNYDGAILITKNANRSFIEQVMGLYPTFPNMILHIDCTGYGGTKMEPYVPEVAFQLDAIEKLLRNGFPKDHFVLRIDPIIPTPYGLKMVEKVLSQFLERKTGIKRVRFSLLDEYQHVKNRFLLAGMLPIYERFQPTLEMKQRTIQLLHSYRDLTFESCAEDSVVQLAKVRNIKSCGCISKIDLDLFGLPYPKEMTENNQNRMSCHCLSCKIELLEQRKQCPHKCLYCYWHNDE